jgi:hypothetical protein
MQKVKTVEGRKVGTKYLKVPKCEASTLEKSHPDSLLTGYSEHLHLSAQTEENQNARDNLFINWLNFFFFSNSKLNNF